MAKGVILACEMIETGAAAGVVPPGASSCEVEAVSGVLTLQAVLKDLIEARQGALLVGPVDPVGLSRAGAGQAAGGAGGAG